MLNRPFWLYNNWSAYDELSDDVKLTEALAMRQLHELLRLKSLGVPFDGYLMDAFWFEPDGSYLKWRREGWPNGPELWLDACRENGIAPGLWFAGNQMSHLDPMPEWADSYCPGWNDCCCFYGGFLASFMRALEHWYDRGVRIFKIDFFSQSAAPPHLRATMLPSEVRELNSRAFCGAVRAFKLQRSDAVFLGYNGLEEFDTQSHTDGPVQRSIDPRWLDAFDTIYPGDPRPADIPTSSFWRSFDVYSCHTVAAYWRGGLPYERIDSSSFMVGMTGTCCHRGKLGWKAMLLLLLSRGGHLRQVYGNLEQFSTEDASWFAEVARLFDGLVRPETSFLGGMPGEEKPYSWVQRTAGGSLVLTVNPSLQTAEAPLPAPDGTVLFHDPGFEPRLQGQAIKLAPGQIALVGQGRFAFPSMGLGQSGELPVSGDWTKLATIDVTTSERNAAACSVDTPGAGTLRIVVRQKGLNGRALRTTGGAPPDGTPIDQLLVVSASQSGTTLPLKHEHSHRVWSGLSWAASTADLTSTDTVQISVQSHDPRPASLTFEAYFKH